MKLKEAQKETERREAILSKFMEEQTTLRGKVEILQQERSQAVRDLAALPSDDPKATPLRKWILDREERIAPLALRLEGLSDLITEAESSLSEAREAFQQIERETKARLNAFLEGKENEFRERMNASLPGRMKEIIARLVELRNLIAETQLAGIKVSADGSARRDGDLEKLFFMLPTMIGQEGDRADYRSLPWRGWPGIIELHPVLIPTAEGLLPGKGPVDAGEVARNRRNRRLEQWTKEFLEAEK